MVEKIRLNKIIREPHQNHNHIKIVKEKIWSVLLNANALDAYPPSEDDVHLLLFWTFLPSVWIYKLMLPSCSFCWNTALGLPQFCIHGTSPACSFFRIHIQNCVLFVVFSHAPYMNPGIWYGAVDLTSSLYTETSSAPVTSFAWSSRLFYLL